MNVFGSFTLRTGQQKGLCKEGELLAIFDSETLGPGINMHINLTHTTYLNTGNRSHTYLKAVSSFSRIIHPAKLQEKF